jgi:hypothetical protein
MASADFEFMTLRNLTAYQPDGTRVLPNYMMVTSTNGGVLFTDNITISSINTSSIITNSILTSTISANTVTASSILANFLNVSIELASTIIVSSIFPDTIYDNINSGGNLGQILTAGSGGELYWADPSGIADVEYVSSGRNITVDNTDYQKPIINLNNSIVLSTIVTSTISSLTILDKTGAFGLSNQVLKADGTGTFSWATDTTGGIVDSVVGGNNITIDSTIVANPIVNLNSSIIVSTIVTSTISSLTILDKNGAIGLSNQVLKADGTGTFSWATDTAGGIVDSVVGGNNITVDSTIVANPIVNLNSSIIVSTIVTSTISSLTILDKSGAIGLSNQVLKADGTGTFSWATDTAGGIVDSVVGGNNITVNSTIVTNPIVNLNSSIIVSSLTTSTLKTTTLKDTNGSTGVSNQVLLTLGSSGVVWSTLQTGTVLPNGGFINDYLSWSGSAWISSSQNDIRIGLNTGPSLFGNSIGIGVGAGQTSQGFNSIAFGVNAGQTSQGADSIAIGRIAGQTNQSTNAIAIGEGAGNSNQQDNTIAVGQNAGQISQSTSAIAIGYLAGQVSQGQNSIAIGKYAGYGQNGNSGGIYIQKSNSIILNASGTFETWPLVDNALYIRPIRNEVTSVTNYLLQYSTGTSEITYNTAKTFVIDHPKNPERYLVHACLEGPEDGIYYRGKGEIMSHSNSTIVTLPDYVDTLGTDFTVQITPIFNGTVLSYAASEITNGSFTVHGQPGRFFWLVHGKRSTFNVEPLKASARLMGNGPYKWLEYTKSV